MFVLVHTYHLSLHWQTGAAHSVHTGSDSDTSDDQAENEVSFFIVFLFFFLSFCFCFRCVFCKASSQIQFLCLTLALVWLIIQIIIRSFRYSHHTFCYITIASVSMASMLQVKKQWISVRTRKARMSLKEIHIFNPQHEFILLYLGVYSFWFEVFSFMLVSQRWRTCSNQERCPRWPVRLAAVQQTTYRQGRGIRQEDRTVETPTSRSCKDRRMLRGYGHQPLTTTGQCIFDIYTKSISHSYRFSCRFDRSSFCQRDLWHTSR